MNLLYVLVCYADKLLADFDDSFSDVHKWSQEAPISNLFLKDTRVLKLNCQNNLTILYFSFSFEGV